MPPDHVSVIGAGPAGLAAAIALARGGVPVTVYEQHRTPGRRFHGDFQGLENWTTEEDVLHRLERLGIAIDFGCRPLRALTLADSELIPHLVEADRPLVYVVKRGPDEDSFDSRLAAQAAALGVTFRFGWHAQADELAGPVIVATGPQRTQGIVAGMVATTSHPDQIVAIASDEIAPKGYAYCVIWSGRATLATVLMRDFDRAWECLEGTRRAFARLGLADFREIHRFGGRAHVSATDPLSVGSRLYVGEAAGLQDYLFGFGLRYATTSGHLAARALLGGGSYDELVARHLAGPLRAGFVNRLLYNATGDRTYGRLIRWLARPGRARRRARLLYSLTPLHRALWPVAALAARAPDADRARARHGAAAATRAAT